MNTKYLRKIGVISLFIMTLVNVIGFMNAVESSGTDDLVAYWSFDEGSGNTAYDTAGSNHGTIYGNPSWVNGVSGNALELDGINDYILVNDHNDLDLDYTDFSISFWCKPKDSGYQMDMLFKGYPGVNHDGSWAVRNALSDNTWIFQNLDITSQHPGYNPTPTPLNDWSMVTMTYDDSMGYFKTYINDALDFSTTHKMELRNTYRDLYIGSVIGSHAFFKGTIDEIRIYHKVLTSNEIQTLYEDFNLTENPDEPTEPESNSLVAYWSFDDNSNLGYDDSGNGYHGTNYGAAWTSKGVSGGALEFDGMDDYVRVDSVPGSTEYTYSTWVKVYGMNYETGEYHQLVLFHSKDGRPNIGNSNGVLLISREDLEIQELRSDVYSNSGSYNDLRYDFDFFDNKFHHIVATFNKNFLHLYLDGELVNSKSIKIGELSSEPYPVFIGNDNLGSHVSGFDSPFYGIIDEIRIYNYALSASEIENLYSSVEIEDETIEAPDLFILDNDISFSNQNPSVGEEITIHALVHNQGDIDASCTVTFSTQALTTIGSKTIQVNAGQSTLASVPWVIPDEQPHEISAIITDVSPQDSLLENNQASNALYFNEGEPMLVISLGTSNIAPIEENTTRTIPINVYCYNNSIQNVQLVVLDSGNLTAKVLTPIQTLQPGDKIDYLLEITVPTLDENISHEGTTIIVQAKGDNEVYSNAEAIDLISHESVETPGFTAILLLAATGTGALVAFFRRRNGNR